MAKFKQKSMRYDQNDYEALRASNIPASLVGTRFDSAEDASVFFARELDYVKSQSYDVEYPELTALSLFPMSSEVDPGAETVTYYSYDKVGLAKIISNYATDLPRADVKGKPTTAIIKSLGASYGYSIQEMRASAMAGKSLDTRKAEAARYQIDYLNNKIAWCGDEETGLRKPVELILPDDDDLVAQLSGRKYGLTEASKIKIESKDAVKKRGQPSPDEADCVLLLCLPVKPPKRKKEAKRHG